MVIGCSLSSTNWVFGVGRRFVLNSGRSDSVFKSGKSYVVVLVFIHCGVLLALLGVQLEKPFKSRALGNLLEAQAESLVESVELGQSTATCGEFRGVERGLLDARVVFIQLVRATSPGPVLRRPIKPAACAS